MPNEIFIYDSFVAKLLAELPGLQPIYDAPLQAYDEVFCMYSLVT